MKLRHINALPILFGLSACSTMTPKEPPPPAQMQSAKDECQIDRALVKRLGFPERPNGTLTNGYMVEALKGLRIAIEADNTRKEELLKQVDKCQGY